MGSAGVGWRDGENWITIQFFFKVKKINEKLNELILIQVHSKPLIHFNYYWLHFPAFAGCHSCFVLRSPLKCHKAEHFSREAVLAGGALKFPSWLTLTAPAGTLDKMKSFSNLTLFFREMRIILFPSVLVTGLRGLFVCLVKNQICFWNICSSSVK